MKLSPDGNWVVCYHDLNGENGGQGTGGAISCAISIVNLKPWNIRKQWRGLSLRTFNSVGFQLGRGDQ